MVTKKDNIKNFGIFLMLIPIFQPKIFTQYEITTYFYIIINFVLLSYLLVLYYKNEIKISKPCIVWVFYRIWLLLSGIFFNNLSGILQWGYLSIMVVNLFLIFELCEKEKQKQLLFYIFILSTILLFINLITLLIYPRGIIKSSFYDVTSNDYYFLGIKTQITTMIFPGLSSIIVLYQSDKKKYKLFLVFFIIIALFNIFYKNISTAIVGLIILLFLYGLRKITKINFSAKFCIIAVVIFQLLIVFFNIQVLFSSFFVDVLHKDITFSARTYIWKNAKELIKNEEVIPFLFGNGIPERNEIIFYSGDYWQPHNQLLVWIINSGIFGTLFFLYYIYMLLKNRGQQEVVSSSYKNNMILCFTEMLLTVTEVYFDTAVCYVPFLIMYFMTDYMYIKKEKINE